MNTTHQQLTNTSRPSGETFVHLIKRAIASVTNWMGQSTDQGVPTKSSLYDEMPMIGAPSTAGIMMVVTPMSPAAEESKNSEEEFKPWFNAKSPYFQS